MAQYVSMTEMENALIKVERERDRLISCLQGINKALSRLARDTENSKDETRVLLEIALIMGSTRLWQ
jgi:hypothetical protein